MMKCTTAVPNIVFDKHLPYLKEAELKVLLIIIRQTHGWVDKRTGRRKTRDRISHSQFMTKTALSRRIVSAAIKSLVEKGLINVTDFAGNLLIKPHQRQGVTSLYYSWSESDRITSVSEVVRQRRMFG